MAGFRQRLRSVRRVKSAEAGLDIAKDRSRSASRPSGRQTETCVDGVLETTGKAGARLQDLQVVWWFPALMIMPVEVWIRRSI